MASRSAVPRWFWWFSGLLLLSCSVGVVALVWWAWPRLDSGTAARELEPAYREYRRLGLPFVAADITPKPPVTGEENAAPLLKQAIRAFKYSSFNKDRREITKLIREGQVEAAEKTLERYQRGMEMAAAAAKKPRVDWKRDWDLGPMVLFPEYAPMKGLVQAHSLRAHLRAQKGDVAGSLSDTRTSLDIGRLAGQEPHLISSLVRIACETITLDAATRVADAFKGNAEALGGLQAELSRSRDRPSLNAALRGEMFFGVATIRNLQHFKRDGSVDVKKLQRDGLPRNQMQRAFLARHMQYWIKAHKILEARRDDPMSAAVQLEKLQAEIYDKKQMSQILLAMLVPTYEQTGIAYVRLDANWATTRALVWALHRESLGQRVTELPSNFIDPFMTLPLKLKRTPDGKLLVYSVGPDKVDNQGRDRSDLPEAERKTGQWDVVASNPPVKRGLPAEPK